MGLFAVNAFKFLAFSGFLVVFEALEAPADVFILQGFFFIYNDVNIHLSVSQKQGPVLSLNHSDLH